jgi:oligosaccharide reducing-end xylanase
MKRISILIVLLSLNILYNKSFSKTIPGTYEVATWQGFREAAISYTFDDDCPNQLAVAIPLFNEFNYRVTMFVPINRITDWMGLQKAADKGNEIASHTVSHTNLGELTLTQQLHEFKDSQNTINAHIKGHSCRTIAYPYCVPGNDSLCGLYYLAARHCQGSVESKTPADFMKISSMGTGAASMIRTVQDFNNRVEKADSINGWCVFLIHGIDNDGGYSPTQSSVLRLHLAYVQQHSDRFWVAPFGEIVCYIRERNAVTVYEVSDKKSGITLKVSDNLENSIYNYPVTIRRTLPKNWKSATAMQNNKKIKTKIVKKGPLKYIMFDAVPDNGEILLRRSNSLPAENRLTNNKIM